LAPHAETDLNAPERLVLLNDEWALVRAGRQTAADYLTLASGYGREPISGVLEEIARRLDSINQDLTTAASQPKLQAFTASLFRPMYDEVGFTAASGDDDNRRELRGVLIRTLGTTGQDAEVIAKSRAALDRALSGGPALDSTVAGAVVTTAAIHGDAKLFDALAAAADRSESPEEQYRYLYALAAFHDPTLIDRGLERSLTSQIRTQDTALYLSRFLFSPTARPRAWAFIREHWTALEPKVTIFGGDTNLTRALGAFCDAGSRDEVQTFFEAHPLPAAARTLAQALEQINNCIALKEKQTPAVANWLATR
jgi:aminopeptidase N